MQPVPKITHSNFALFHFATIVYDVGFLYIVSHAHIPLFGVGVRSWLELRY
jgi:hypothetical protein